MVHVDDGAERAKRRIGRPSRVENFRKLVGEILEDKADLPDKIFKDCQNCPRLHRCDEVAMVRGRLPRISLLGPREEAQQLVHLAG